MACLTQVSPAAGTWAHGAPGPGPAADIRAPTHMHTSWGVPPPEEELEMEFNEKTEETVVTGHWASPDNCTDQPPA